MNEKESEENSTHKIQFTEWNWEERRKQSDNPAPDLDKRCKKEEFEIKREDLLMYEENLKWESILVSDALQEARKRKFFAINASMIVFPGLVAGFLSVVSILRKMGFPSVTGEGQAEFLDHYWITLVIISMFVGMANMISIKYIAAYKAQANLFLRQLNCLRQARDSITYYKFEGKYPIHLKELIQASKYYKVFGKHRKLYIGNEELRNRMEGSYSDSADKSLIGFLFITSLTLVSAPIICLSVIAIHKWNNIATAYPFFNDQEKLIVAVIAINMGLLIASTAIFIAGHWENFKKLRTNYLNSEDTLEKEEKSRANEIEIFKTKWTDHVSRILVLILAIFWICLGLKEISVFSVIMTTLALISLVLIIICVNKVFFDSLNRIHKSIMYRLEISISDKSKKSQSTDSSREKSWSMKLLLWICVYSLVVLTIFVLCFHYFF